MNVEWLTNYYHKSMEDDITYQRPCFEEDGEIVQRENELHRSNDDDHVLQFLDSMDDYLTLFDSLSSTLRQGWLELAGARHSMGSSRVNGSLLDLKLHSASTTLQVTDHAVDSEVPQACFTLCKWTSPDDDERSLKKEESLQVRYRGRPEHSETASVTNKNVDELIVDKVQRERSKSLSVFGSLVSPKLRASQLSFERALEILVEVANKRSSMFASFDHISHGLDHTKR